MRICIYGAGAVGSFLAARLANAGFDVAAIARGAQLAALQANGITLEEANGTIQARVKASDNPADFGPQDAVIFTTKAHSLAAVAGPAQALIGPDTALVFAQNGIPWWYGHAFEAPGLASGPSPLLDPDGAIWNGFRPERAIGAVIYSPNTVVSPGVIRNKATRPAEYPLGQPNGGADAPTKTIAKALEAANIKAPILDNIRHEVWMKLIINIYGAPCCTLTGASVKGSLSQAGMDHVAKTVMAEGIAVAKAHGFDLDINIDNYTDPAKRPDHKSSMLQDFEAGRRMEVDPIIGCAHEFARAAGIQTPVLDVLLPLVRAKAHTAGLYGDAA